MPHAFSLMPDTGQNRAQQVEEPYGEAPLRPNIYCKTVNAALHIGKDYLLIWVCYLNSDFSVRPRH